VYASAVVTSPSGAGLIVGRTQSAGIGVSSFFWYGSVQSSETIGCSAPASPPIGKIFPLNVRRC
jgi:hypothetical protein